MLAGPNGAGKSTSAPRVLRDLLEIDYFVNADVIAQGLSAYAPEKAAIQAGRIMLERLDELSEQRVSFALETTLSGRTYARRLTSWVDQGYQIHLIYLWLNSPDLAVERVATRVRKGGHSIPEETIRRRYFAGLRNLFDLYLPLVNSWEVFDNTSPGRPLKVAYTQTDGWISVNVPLVWNRIHELAQSTEA